MRTSKLFMEVTKKNTDSIINTYNTTRYPDISGYFLQGNV